MVSKTLEGKKILVITEFFKKIEGGAEKSLLEILQNQQYKLIAFDEPVTLFRFTDIALKGKKVLKINPKGYDIIVTQSLLAPYAIQLAKKYSIPSIYFVRDELQVNQFKNYFTGFKRIAKDILDFAQSSQIKKYKRLNAKALQDATYVVANSKYIQKKINRKDTKVKYPLKPLKKKLKKKKGDYILFIGGHSVYKGPDIVEKIAHRLPQEHFIIITKNVKHKKAIENITYLPWKQDMDKLYKNAKLTLMPSIWNEAFGRIPVESVAKGVPCISSSKGGLPESNPYPQNLVKNVQDIDEWIQKIKKWI